GVKNINYDRHLKDIARDKRYWEKKRQSIRLQEKRLEELMADYENEFAGIKNLKKELITNAKQEAQKLLDDSNRIIENTIRSIKESQADKEKTKEDRRKLETFKTEIQNEPLQPPALSHEQKVISLRQKAKKIKPNLVTEKQSEQKIDKELPLKSGDAVRMIETMAVGEIISIKGKTAEIETNNIRIRAPLDKIERISRKELKKSIARSTSFNNISQSITPRNLNFKPEIDIRGVRGEEAINLVRDLVDNAFVVRHRNLRILHGKGNGILRQLVREYLATCGVVKIFRDEHVELGGAGITIVEMDV
ncbi:MAG: Smr/MutS family protein, partial [Chitinispirillales bacterium]|nr:Smr/MutS family protein [Chitinispirillales bacterium]